MRLFALPGGLQERQAAALGGLRPLADSLANDLAPVIAREVWIPPEKARLTRRGGRCEADGTVLEFDPFSPREHRCPTCGRTFADEAHYRWWIMGYQLWLAERAVHEAALAALRRDAAAGAFAERVLDAYADRYLTYPNRDNVLGPTRVFFSTYLESIWLLQLCVALDLLESTGQVNAALGARVRERVIVPSATLIASYDEGLSNRQVWNDAALMAAGRMLGDDARVDAAMHGPSGMVRLLRDALLGDGTWYEGENYHLFAHRGLWYCREIARAAGVAIPGDLLRRFEEGFATPFLTALPDFTFPSRRDSQYGVSLRQWRFAELAELGLIELSELAPIERDDPRLLGALRTLYDPDAAPRRDTGRARSTAEAERNTPATRLDRSDLGWRSLLFARPQLPALDAYALEARSALLFGQGLAILRRDPDGATYAALDYGHSGAGHGHPDRLNVMLATGAARCLDDPGTGSYVDPTLHWYRSTLAHNAPLVDGRSQRRVHGELLAWEERGGAGWVSARVREAAPGVELTRTLVAMPDYLLDVLEWEATRDITLDLPVHVDGDVRGLGAWAPAALTGGDGTEDGFSFLRETERASGDGTARVTVVAPPAPSAALGAEARADLWLASTTDTEWWRAVAPGPPGAGSRRFLVLRTRGHRGVIRSVWSWRGAVRDVAFGSAEAPVAVHAGSERHEHSRSDDGWHIALATGAAHSSIDLGGLVTVPVPAADTTRSTRSELAPHVIPRRGEPLVLPLGAAHYRRSEETWEEAGSPSAEVRLSASDAALRIDIVVYRSDPVFAPRSDDNLLDNEHPDINSDGVQLHIALPAADGEPRVASWILVPEPTPDRPAAVRITKRLRPAHPLPLAAAFLATPLGYEVHCRIPIGHGALPVGTPFHADVIVNEIAPGRERRRGQLVLSGGGDFVYLRGDRQDAEHFLPFIIADV